MTEILISPTLSSWQSAARELLHNSVSPTQIIWRERSSAQTSLFSQDTPPSSSRPEPCTKHTAQQRNPHSDRPTIKVPKRFLDIARRVALHNNPRRWALLYSVLWRVVHQDRNLLSIRVDDEVHQLLRMHWEVGADAHRMKSLLRFRRVQENGQDTYIAWYEPDHFVVPMVAPHFVDKFASMHWAILTSDCCAYWDGSQLRFSAGVDRSRAPQDDQLEELWKTFYRSTFNPARLSMKTMRSEMPVRFWNNLPEAEVIGKVVSEAPGTVQQMMHKTKKESL